MTRSGVTDVLHLLSEMNPQSSTCSAICRFPRSLTGTSSSAGASVLNSTSFCASGTVITTSPLSYLAQKVIFDRFQGDDDYM